MKMYILELEEEQYRELLTLVWRGAELTRQQNYKDVHEGTIKAVQKPRVVEDAPPTPPPPRDSIDRLNDRLSQFLKGPQ